MDQMSYYATVPAWMLSMEMPSAEKLMCVLLSALSQRDGFCFATNAFIGNALGISEGAVKNILRRLNDIGIIKIVNKKTKVAGNRKIYLQFVETNMCPVANVTEETRISSTNSGIDSIDAAFDKFYTIYPRKEKKVLALKMFKSKKLYGRIDDLIQATKNYSVKNIETDVKFIMLPVTFLNNEIWEENITANDLKKNSNGAVVVKTGFDAFVVKSQKLASDLHDNNKSNQLDGMSADDMEQFTAKEKQIIREIGFKKFIQNCQDGDYMMKIKPIWEAMQ